MLEHLGREVQRRAGDGAGARLSIAQLQAGAEVHQHHPAAVLAHDVLGFDVAVHQSGRMDGCQRLTELLTDHGGLAGAARAFGEKQLLQRSPADELHAEPDPPVAFLRVVDDDDVRVLDTCQGARLVQHAVDETVVRPPHMEELDRHFALQLRVAGTIDLAKGTLADKLQQFEASPAPGNDALPQVHRRRRGQSAFPAAGRLLLERQHADNGAGAGAKGSFIERARLGALHV